MDRTLHAILHLIMISAFVSCTTESYVTASSDDNTLQENTTEQDQTRYNNSDEPTTTAASFTTVWNYYGSMDSTTNSYTTSTPHYRTTYRPRYATGYPYTTTGRSHYDLNRTKSYNYTTTPYPHITPYPYTTSYPYMRTPYHYQPTSPRYYNPYTTSYNYRPTPPAYPAYPGVHDYGRVAGPPSPMPQKPQTNFITYNFNAPVVYKICVMCRLQKYGSSDEKTDFGKKNETEESYEDPHNMANSGYNDHVW